MFRRRLKAVVPMDPNYLAANDGSNESAGRGSGLKDDADGRGRTKGAEETPYMQMTFAPLERRLDTAIFRALFASSTRQARQFVVHGAVRVNGQKVPQENHMGVRDRANQRADEIPWLPPESRGLVPS